MTKQPTTAMIIFVMGVSGSGKSTVGRLLAEKLDIPFFDGDDFHPEPNIIKMRSGIPLTDKDRKGWLEILNSIAAENRNKGAVIVCSALKASYRNMLTAGTEGDSIFVFLEGQYNLIQKRLNERSGHFMPPQLLKSQFNDLEPPEDAVRVSIDQRPEEIVLEILRLLNKLNPF